MRVPKGKPVHENLGTSYVKVGALLAELQVKQFTGSVNISFRGYDAHVFIDAGSIIGAIENTETAVRTGSDAIDGLLVRSEHRDGQVSIYEHSASTVEALAGIVDGQPVYEGLSSDFTDLDKLIRKLAQDRNAIWYVEVVATEDLGVGVLYIHGGQPDGVYSPFDGPTLSGQAALKAMLEVSDAFGAVFNVYSIPVDIPVAPVAEPITEQPKLSIVRSAEPDTPAVQSAAAASNADAVVPAIRNEEAISPLVLLMSDVVSVIEEAVGSRDGANGFAIELRAGQLEVADRYPFLDPFAAEFEYHAGEIAFVGSVDPEEFAAGLAEALHVAVAGLSRRDGVEGDRMRQRVAEALSQLYVDRRAEFDAFGLEGMLAFIADVDEADSEAVETVEHG